MVTQAGTPHEWLLVELEKVQAGANSKRGRFGLSKGEEMVIVVYGRTGLYTNPKPWFDLQSATQYLRVFIVIREPYECMNLKVLTGWRMRTSESEIPVLWGVFELSKIADCLW